MRVPIPAVPNGAALIVKGDKVEAVLIQNVSSVEIFISENVNALQGSVDSTGTPQDGWVLAPNAFLPFLTLWRTPLYALAAVPGGELNVIVSQPCNP